MLRDIVWPLVALACLAIGYACGKWAGLDKAADEQVEAQFAAMPKRGRHERAEPRLLPAAPKAVSPSTAPMYRELAPLPVPIAGYASPREPWMITQPPLRELARPSATHRPGRTTDAIAKMEADTDRWLAARGML